MPNIKDTPGHKIVVSQYLNVNINFEYLSLECNDFSFSEYIFFKASENICNIREGKCNSTYSGVNYTKF